MYMYISMYVYTCRTFSPNRGDHEESTRSICPTAAARLGHGAQRPVSEY